MSTFRNSGVWLVPSAGATLRVRDAGFRTQMNAGVSWEALAPGYISGTAYDENTTFQLVVRGPGGNVTTQALTLDTFEGQRGTQGRYTRLAGRDILGSKLDTKNYNTDTIWYQDNWTVITQIVNAAFGLTINASTPKFTIREFNVQGTDLGSHISRIMRDSAANWRNNAGAMEIVPNTYTQTPASLGVDTVYISQTTERLNWANKINQVVLHRGVKSPGCYPFRADTTGVFPGDIAGGLAAGTLVVTLLENVGTIRLGYVATFAGPGGSGACTGFFPYEGYVGVDPGPLDGSLPTRSCVYVVIPSGFAGDTSYTRFKICGTPLRGDVGIGGIGPGSAEPPDVDYTVWDVTYPTSLAAGVRKRTEVLDSPLWGSRTGWTVGTSADAIAPYVLMELNKGAHTVEHTIDFEPRLCLPGWYLPEDPDFPAARYDSIEWRAGDSGYQMTVNGWVGL